MDRVNESVQAMQQTDRGGRIARRADPTLAPRLVQPALLAAVVREAAGDH